MLAKQTQKKSCSAVIKHTVIVVLALLTTACDQHDDNNNVSQVVAQINGTEITVHQLNAELGRLNAPATTDLQVADAISISVLNDLVNQQLLVAQAKENKMERDPDVVQALEQSKRQILAQAYIQQLLGTVQMPDDKAVADYYNKYPALFKNRKIYTMRLLALSKHTLQPELIEALGGFATLAEAEDYLKHHNIVYQQKMVTSAAEDLPIEAVTKMVDAAEGQLFMQDMPTRISVYDIVNAIDQPVTLEQSRPLINRFLISQSNEKRVLEQVERLRKTTKIKYMGKFSGLNQAAVTETAIAENPANDEAEGIDSESSSQSIERGLSGLK